MQTNPRPCMVRRQQLRFYHRTPLFEVSIEGEKQCRVSPPTQKQPELSSRVFLKPSTERILRRPTLFLVVITITFPASSFATPQTQLSHKTRRAIPCFVL